MAVLHLGVVDLAYSDVGVGGAETTGAVAQILESRYHILEIFAEEHIGDLADDLADSYAGAIDTMIQTGLPPPDPAASAMSRITERMHDWITDGEMEKLGYPGVPTQAALDGVNHRLAHPHAKDNPRRVSFRDSGLYEVSLVAFFEE